MRTYELRTYQLVSKDALETYRNVVYPRHLLSFIKFDIGLHGIWTDKTRDDTLYVLVSHPENGDPKEVEQAYMASPEFLDDVEGFDLSQIVSVEAKYLEPSAGSSLL